MLLSLLLSSHFAMAASAPKHETFLEYKDPIFAHYPKPDASQQSVHIKKFRVTVLDDMVIDRSTDGEWGYSALVDGVDADGKAFSILFDTGASTDTVWNNIHKMKDPDDPSKDLTAKVCGTSTVLLSHDHQDHTAGLLTLRRECVKAGYPDALKVAYLGGPEAQWSREDRTVAANPDGTYPIENYLLYPSAPGKSDNPAKGTIEKQYRDLGGRFEYLETPRQLAPGVWTSGKVFRTTPEKAYWQYGEDGPMIGADGKLYHDNVPEDHGLVLNTTDGLVVLTGCGHAGIVNVIQHARQWVVAGNRPVVAVVGGIHLFAANLQDLGYVKNGFQAAGVRYLLGSHCTGLESVVWLRKHAGLRETNAVMGAIGTMIGSADGKIAISWPPGPMVNRHPSLVQ